MLVKIKIAFLVWWRFFIRSFTMAKLTYEAVNTRVFLGDTGVFTVTVNITTMPPISPTTGLQPLERRHQLKLATSSY